MSTSAPDKPAQQTAPPAPPDANAHAAQTNQAQALSLYALPAGIIDPTETILLIVKPSLWMIAIDAVRTVLIVASLAYLALKILPTKFESLDPQIIYAFAGSLIAMKVFWLLLGWVWRFYIITDKRILIVWGIARIRTHERPLSKIEGLQVHHSFIERILGLGTLTFTISSESGLLLWRVVANPVSTAQEAWRLIERYAR